MKLNPREIADKLAEYRDEHGARPDPLGYGIGDRIGAAMREIAQDHQNSAADTISERRRRRSIYEMHIRRIYAQVLCQILLYAHDNKVFISFEQAESFVVGQRDKFVYELFAMFLQNYSTVWSQIKLPRDEDHEVLHRVSAQKLFNTTFAIIANSKLGDPMIDVFEPYLQEILNEPTYSSKQKNSSSRSA